VMLWTAAEAAETAERRVAKVENCILNGERRRELGTAC
jgi:hypothetical protein